MYDNADRSPILVGNMTLNNVMITTGIGSRKTIILLSLHQTLLLTVFTSNISKINVTVSVYNATGQIVNADIAIHNENAKIVLQIKKEFISSV